MRARDTHAEIGDPGIASDYSSGRRGVVRRGYTLVEILVTISIIAILVSLLLPAMGRSMETARGFQCQLNLRSVAFDFNVFSDSMLHGSRGTDRRSFGPNRFSIETFMESQYCVDEYWCFQGQNTTVRTMSQHENDVMRCTEVRGDVVYRRSTPCRDGAVGPVQNVSYGFNSRLFRAETVDAAGRPRTQEVQLTSTWVNRHPNVPLAWDVDGEAAADSGASLSIFSAPSLDSQGPYADDRLWWPGNRHAGKANYALIDGSVHGTSKPLQTGWNWSAQPIN